MGLAIILWCVSTLRMRRGEVSGWMSALALAIVVSLAARELALAAALPPYNPGWRFWLGALLIAAAGYGASSNAWLAWEASSGDDGAPALFSWRSAAALIVAPLAAASAQYFYIFRSVAWYVPMAIWAAGVYVLFRTVLPNVKRRAYGGIAAPFISWGSVGAVEDDSADDPDDAPSRPGRVETPRWAWWALGAIVLIGACLYLTSPAAYPTDSHGDEAEVAMYGINLRDSGEWNFFSLGWYKIPNFFFLIPAWGMSLFGDTLEGLRVSSGLITLACIPIVFLIARRLMNTASALIGVFLFTASSYIIQFSRVGVTYNQATLFYTASFYFILRGLQDRCYASIALAGFIGGLGWLSYQPCMLIPFLAGASMLIVWMSYRISHRRFMHSLGVYALAFWTAFAPVCGAYARDPSAVFFRAMQVSRASSEAQIFDRDLSHAEILRRAVLAPFSVPDRSPYLTNDHSGGMFDPLPAVFLLAGLIQLAAACYRPGSALMLFWPVITLLLGGAMTNSTPGYQRLTGAYPFFALIAAPALYGALDRVLYRWRANPPARAALIAAFLALCLALTSHRYFSIIQGVPQLQDDSTRVARYIESIAPETYVYFFGRGHFSLQYGNIRFIAHNPPGENVMNPEAFLADEITHRGPVSFVLIRGNSHYIDAIRARFPGGREVVHRNVQGLALFTTYEVNL